MSMFINIEFEKLNKTATEKKVIDFEKTILGLNRKASNDAAHVDIGDFLSKW